MAVALGWPRDRVEIIDADQARTGQTVEGRPGLQYILAELSLDHVGILMGQDASRLARHDPDWVPLVRSCGLFGRSWATTMASTTPTTSTTVSSWA